MRAQIPCSRDPFALVALLVVASVALPVAPSAAARPAGDVPPGTLGSVELLDEGDEPRLVQRLVPTPSEQSVEARYALRASERVKDSVERTEPGDMVFTVDGRTLPYAPGDAFTLLLTFSAAEIETGPDPNLDNDLDLILDDVVGAVATTTVESTGEVVDVRTSLDDASDPDSLEAAAALSGFVEQLDDQLSARFPEEPIGEGARWRVTSAFELEGVQITNRYEYRLREIDATTLTIDLRVVQTARRGARTAAAEGGRGLQVVSYRNTGTGRIVQDLNRLVPVESTLELAGRHVFRSVDADGEVLDTRLIQRFESRFSIAPPPVSAPARA